MISAENAMKITKDALNSKAKLELEKCEKAIILAAKLGFTTARIEGTLLEETRCLLVSMGYSIYVSNIDYDYPTTVISWEKHNER